MISLLVALVVLIAAACWARMRGYRRWFRISSTRADHFAFRSRSAATDLSLGPRGFSLRVPREMAARTVILELDLRPSMLGTLFDPFIELDDGRGVTRQYFERGVRGTRYLNLSHLRWPAPGSEFEVRMRGVALEWQSRATLFVFDPPELGEGEVMVLAPHPDDAEIAAFGLYASRRSWVVAVTAGERGTITLPSHVEPSARPRWTASLRVRDSLQVPQLGEVPPDRCANLVYPDGALEAMYREPQRRFQLSGEDSAHRVRLRAENPLPQLKSASSDCTWTELVEELRVLLDHVHPRIVLCPHPLIDAHSDHVFVTVALEQAVARAASPAPILLLYSVHAAGSPMYPYGPAQSLICFPPGQHDEPVAERPYSYPLTTELQRKKRLAVASMRGVDGVNVVMRWSSARAIGCGLLNALAGLKHNPIDLLRRAPRPNEIYYVAQPEMLTDLVRRALERRGASARA